MGMILMIAVTVVVAAYTAGAAASLLAQGATYATAAGAATVSASTAASLSFGMTVMTGGLAVSSAAMAAGVVASAAIGAAVGSIAGQLTGMVTGNVNKFSWNAVGQATLTAGITAGVGTGLNWAASTGNFLSGTSVGSIVSQNGPGAAMIRAGLGNAVSQTLQGQWSWREVGAATVASGAGYYAGQAVGSVLSDVNQGVAKVAAGAVGAVGGTWASSQVMGYNSTETKARLGQAFISGLGQGLANTIADGDLSRNIPGRISAEERAQVLEMFEQDSPANIAGQGLRFDRPGSGLTGC